MAVWERHVPATLLGGTDEEALVQAAADIELWGSQGHTFLTILDEDYPGRLRGIHEAPPVLFGDGEFRRDDPAVSVVDLAKLRIGACPSPGRLLRASPRRA